MKKVYVVIGLFLLSCFQLLAQNQSDTIQVKKTFLGTVFRQYGKNLTPGKLLEITSSNQEAYKEMKIAKRNYDIGYVFGFVGGFMMGWPVGTAIAGGEPEWALAGAGAGLTIVSIPFTSAYIKHAKKAVKLYNVGARPVNVPAELVAIPDKPKLLANTEGIYFTSADSSYQKYIARMETILKQDKKIISFKFRETTYNNDKIKSRGFEAKHQYGVNEDYTYKIGTWEFYTADGLLEKTVHYDMRSNPVYR